MKEEGGSNREIMKETCEIRCRARVSTHSHHRPICHLGLCQLLRPIHSRDRKSTRLNSSHANISYAVFCLKKKKDNQVPDQLDVVDSETQRMHVAHPEQRQA